MVLSSGTRYWVLCTIPLRYGGQQAKSNARMVVATQALRRLWLPGREEAKACRGLELLCKAKGPKQPQFDLELTIAGRAEWG